jgi:Uma2 family endonuclease
MSIQDPPAAATGPSLAGGISPYRFSIDQYHQMVATGIRAEDERVQLLEGEVVRMTPIGPLHRYAVVAGAEALSKLLPAEWKLMIQQPITLANSEPEPDLCIVRSESARYLDRHPGANDVALVIEVADSSLPLDRGMKQRVYAAAGIPVYFLVNLAARNVEAFSEPRPATEQQHASYQTHKIFDDQTAVEIELAGRRLGEIRVGDLMPPAAD